VIWCRRQAAVFPHRAWSAR